MVIAGRCWLLAAACCLLLAACCLLLAAAGCLLLAACCLLLAAGCLLLAACCLLLAAYCLLPTTYWLLVTSYWLLLLGSLSRLSIDDKGTCAKVTFGLPPLFHNDDPARAVRCALLIRDNVRPMRLKANIGITTGTVFIGYVGASTRGEYTEYGVMVNMAARFMGKAPIQTLHY